MSKQAASNVPNGAQVFNAIFPGTSYKIALTGTSAVGALTQASTSIARLVSDTDCWVLIASAPVATLTSVYLPAKTPVFFGINGGTDKIAGISAGAGNLYVTEGA